MAGYFLHSISSERFDSFVKKPSEEELLALAGIVSEELDQIDDEVEDDDPIADWPVEPEELRGVLGKHLSQEDWYSLSDVGCRMMESALQEFFESEELFDFKPESNGIYWDVIELIRRHHGLKPDAVPKHPLLRFGLLPFRCHKVGNFMEGFCACHSLHLPEEVHQLLADVKAAEETVMNSKDENAKREFEEELVPILERISSRNRVLIVSVDT